MSTKRGHCHFCKEEVVRLHKKSHILSSFLFKNIYGDDGKRLIEVDVENWEEKRSHADSPYEKWIFCKECELKHSALESKASYLLNHIDLSKAKVLSLQRGILKQNIFEEIETDIIHKFWMLNLYRAHLSSRSLFEMVNLGPYAEKFRLILNGSLPTKESNLYIHIFVLKDVMKKLSKLSSPIYKLKIGSKRGYKILIDGVGYMLHFGYPDVELLKETFFEFNGKGRVNFPDNKSSKIVLDIFSFKSEIIDLMP